MKVFFIFAVLLLSSTCFASNGRALLVVIDLAEEATKLKPMYRAETKTAVKRIQRLTQGHYDRLIIHHRKEATRENFLGSLDELLNDPSVRTIDTIIYVHGKNAQYSNGPSLCFVGETPCPSADEVSHQVAALAHSATKLRALYSDACWGKFHLDAWISAGFKVANGSVGVDSNHSLDLRRFLKKWVAGESFLDANNFANSARFTRVTDWLIEDADSLKVVQGNAEIKITDDLN